MSKRERNRVTDVLLVGEAPKLEKLLAAVNSNDTSHILEVPVGPKLLSDVLLSSAIVNPDGEAWASVEEVLHCYCVAL